MVDSHVEVFIGEAKMSVLDFREVDMLRINQRNFDVKNSSEALICCKIKIYS